MDYPFAVIDGVVRIYRYRVAYKTTVTDGGKTISKVGIEFFQTFEEAQALAAQHPAHHLTTLDTSDYRWMDGIPAASFEEAAAIYEAGESLYRRKIRLAAVQDPEQLMADLDFLAMWEGVTL